LDLALDRIEHQTVEAEQELGLDSGLEPMEAALREEAQRLQEFQDLLKTQRLDLESQRERSAHLDGQLYGGTITAPRDLASLEQEASNVRDQLAKQDAGLVELSLQAEESQEKCATLEKKIAETQSSWETRQAELKEEMTRLATEQDGVAERRLALAAKVEPAALHQYETLRNAKGGLGVARVERGLCQACRISLPTQQLQQVRSGRGTVLCSTCGRILFFS
jgi:predicted  nucleic acid-binding Zn-ribbon protein